MTQALSYTERLQAGTVWVSNHTLIDANLPFGGMKQSGTGRDFGGLAGRLVRNEIGLRALLTLASAPDARVRTPGRVLKPVFYPAVAY